MSHYFKYFENFEITWTSSLESLYIFWGAGSYPTKDTPNQALLVHLLGARSGGLCVGQARSPQGLIWSIDDAKLDCFNE